MNFPKLAELKMKNLEHDREMSNERLKAEDAAKKFQKRIDQLEEEKINKTQEIEDKNVQITKMEADHSEKLNENENKFKTEFEEKIKRMQDDHDQENADREAQKAKLTQDKKGLNNDNDRMEDDQEREIEQLKHENQKEVEDVIEEKNADWRKKFMAMERDFENKHKELNDEITYLENKIRDVQRDDDGRWQVNLKEKQYELDVTKEDLEQKLEAARQEISDRDDKFRKEKLKMNADHKEKMTQKVREKTEDFKKKLEEREKTLTNNLKYELNLKEIDHKYRMEMKDMELATVAEDLARAQAMKNDVGELMGYF